MNESMNARTVRKDIQRWLLTGVSAASLLAGLAAPSGAAAENSDKPVFWIELGGEFTHVQADQDAYLPPAAQTTQQPPFASPSLSQIEKLPASSWDGSAKLSFEPSGSDWIFSGGIKFGRNGLHENKSQVTPNPTVPGYTARYHYPTGFGTIHAAFRNTISSNTASHIVLDFQVGKDLGLGMWGGNSLVSFGVRFAQFGSRSASTIVSQPTNVNSHLTFYRNNASFEERRSFVGIGPSLSWDGSVRMFGNPSASSVSLDWGASAAVLFGRQKATGHHDTTEKLYYPYYQHATKLATSVPVDRHKQVIVPNLGGFAGVSWRYPNAKVSLGYRADFFFGAMDGGIDTPRRENVGFYGPFATVSVGIGG